MAARWPVAEEVNETLLREADYLLAVSHEFRVRLKKMMDLRGKVCYTFAVCTRLSYHKGNIYMAYNNAEGQGIIQ